MQEKIFTCHPLSSWITYGADPYQKMDIYLAATETDVPTIVLIHSGGWSGGDKNELTSSVKGYRIYFGYAVVNINYRLAKDRVAMFSPQENGVKSAIETILGIQANFMFR